MRKRIISIAFSALMIMSVLVVMDIVPVGNVRAVINRPRDDGVPPDETADDGIFVTDGDWTIQIGETWEYSPSGSASEPKPCNTIIVNGHLTIEEVSTLILKGVTLLMNVSDDGQYNITVKNAETFNQPGSLIIEDVDDNPSTPDGSIITSYDGTHRFGFIVEGASAAPKPAASLQFKNSELHNCGWNLTESENFMDAGLWIGEQRLNSGITISNNTISDNYIGITLFRTTGTASININDNKILNNYLGIYLNDTTIPLNIRNNNISGETIYGIAGTSYQVTGLTSELTLEGNTFSNLRGDGTDYRYAAVRINGSTDPTVRNNVLFNNQASGIIIFNAEGYGTLTNNVFEDVEDGNGFWMDGVDGLYAANNIVKAHPTAHVTGTGLAFSDITGNVEIVNNDVRDFDFWWQIIGFQVWIYGGFGIFFRGVFDVGAPTQTDIIARDNKLYDNKAWGLYLDLQNYLPTLRTTATIENNDVQRTGRYSGTPLIGNVGEGINVEGANTQIIMRNNYINESWESGIYIEDGSQVLTQEVICENNDALDNQAYNIYIEGDVISVTGNTAENNAAVGIYTRNLYGGSTTITNNDANNNDGNGIQCHGNTTTEPTTLVITDNNATENGKLGIAVAWVRPPTDNRGYIANNLVTGNGGGYVEYSGGIAVEISSDIDIFNNEIRDNNVLPVIPQKPSGVWVSHDSRITIEECTIDNNDWGVKSYGDTYDILVENCTISNSNIDDFHLDVYTDPQTGNKFYSHVIALNTTFDKSKVAVTNAASDLTCMWYMHVRVQKYGSPQNGAEVTILNITDDPDPSSGQPFTTSTMDGQPGWIKWLKVTEFVERGAVRFMHTPHLAHATYTDAGKPMEGMESPSMDKSKVVIIDLNYIPQIVDFAPGYDVINRTYILYFYLNATDPAPGDPEDDLDVYLEYRDPNELSWNNSYIGTAQYVGGTPPDGYFKIPFTPQSNFTIGWYDFRVRVRDSYPSYSDWTEALDMVYVANNIPVVTSANSGSVSVYRGDTINVWADANDIEDGDDQYFTNATAAIFEYKAPGGNWDDAYLGPEFLYSNDWRAEFTPPGQPTTVTPIGKYSFQFKFIDNDGSESVWYQKDDWIEVLNNPPVVDNLKAGYSPIYRDTEDTYIYANVTEVEDDEKDDLTVVFEHYHTDLGWGTQYLGTPTYVGTSPSGFWKVLFDPDKDAPVGSYSFRVTVTDLDGDSVVLEGGLVDVKNHLPEVEEVRASANSVRRGAEFVYIEVETSDREDPESSLQLIVEYWDTESQSWETDYIGSTIWDDRGWLKVKFEPDSNAPLGKYDFRVKVRDTNGEVSTDWFPADELVEVQNPVPTLIEVKLGDDQVYRGDTLYITVNAKDPVDSEKDLIVELQYKHEDKTGWTDITVLPAHYEGSDDDTGYWEIPFTPDKNFETGKYEFHCRVKNSAQTYSNNGDWTTDDPLSTDPLEAYVLNNRPVASNLRVEGADTVERGGSITIKADGTDFEDDEDDLDAIFEYKSDGSWEDAYLGPADYQGGSWVVEFKPPIPIPGKDVPLGEYDFRVHFVDRNDGASDFIEKSDLVDVQNVIPTVKSILVPSTSGYRLEPITITAEATDPDHPVGEVEPTFQYKGPTGDWVNVDDPGSYFQDQPDLLNERWQITFRPPADADLGKYSFQVKFFDGVDETEDWEPSSDTYEVMNNDPEVEIQTSGVQKSSKVTFDAIASDPEGDSLTWEWDFGDGETSTEESPTHTYKEAKSYTVEVTVTDSDGGTATHDVVIIIEGDGGGGIDMMTLLLILIPLIVAILVLILLLTMKKKKKPEEVPPAVPGMAPTVPPAAPGAPPAPPAPAAIPAAAPAPPPAAVPAAVPAAAPAAAPAGQQIKCPKCGTAFRVESAERPITIECPNCHAKGKLT